MQITSELEQIATTWLAVLCGKAAEDPAMEQATAKEARELKREWAALQIPAPMGDPTKRESKAKEVAVRTRMIDLLSRVLKGL